MELDGNKFPNLDEMNKQERLHFHYVLVRITRYVLLKGWADSDRKAGFPDSATRHEKEAGKLREKLPDWAKW